MIRYREPIAGRYMITKSRRLPHSDRKDVEDANAVRNRNSGYCWRHHKAFVLMASLHSVNFVPDDMKDSILVLSL